MVIKNYTQFLTVFFLLFCSINICCGEKAIIVKKETNMFHMIKESGLFALTYTSPFFIGNHVKTVLNKNNVQPKDFFNLKKIGKSAYRITPLTALAWYGHFMYRRSQLID